MARPPRTIASAVLHARRGSARRIAIGAPKVRRRYRPHTQISCRARHAMLRPAGVRGRPVDGRIRDRRRARASAAGMGRDRAALSFRRRHRAHRSPAGAIAARSALRSQAGDQESLDRFGFVMGRLLLVAKQTLQKSDQPGDTTGWPRPGTSRSTGCNPARATPPRSRGKSARSPRFRPGAGRCAPAIHSTTPDRRHSSAACLDTRIASVVFRYGH